jgi:hypothetical protein
VLAETLEHPDPWVGVDDGDEIVRTLLGDEELQARALGR